MGDEVELPSAYSLTPSNGDPELPHSWGFSGEATAKYTNGDVFVGTYVDGKKHGEGKYTYLNGDVFEGSYDSDAKTGLGKMTYASGASYSGHFENGERSGEGTFVYANKDIYSGTWKAGKKSGKGFYVFAGSKYYYDGIWKDGQIESGQWVFTPEGDKLFEGRFVSQKPCGEGKFVYGDYEVFGAYTQEVKPLDTGLGKGGEPPMQVATTWETFGLVHA